MLLLNPFGNFLIRVSESRIGYTLSYRGIDRCRHFMIDVLKDKRYIIVGEDTSHGSLQELVNYHCKVPIMPFNEKLTGACGQVSNKKLDYAEFMVHKTQPNPGPRLNNPPNMNSVTDLQPPEDIPPALPHRPSTLIDPVSPSTSKPLVTPSSPPPRLYPSLETELNTLSLQNPNTTDAQPVPFPRKIHEVSEAQPDKPPELPSRGPVKPQRNNKDKGTATPDNPPAPRSVFTDRPQIAPKPAHQDPITTQHKNHDVKSGVSNLIKRKFMKMRSASQEHMYAEINVTEVEQGKDRERDTDTPAENQYQMLPGDIDNIPHPISPTDDRLPPEYHPPSPFAPGY
ncbi:hematopoietic SH2 domain-containing protein homolog isoform X2 [Esox lucius]|nr:hematopoietic SH2 domain-containing protein homolog isoform X2 [Esox lucius]